jgi:hypothetical protein
MPTNPYTPPTSEAEIPAAQQKAPGTKLSFIGLILFAFPIISKPITYFMYQRAFMDFALNTSQYESFREELRLIKNIFITSLALGLIGFIFILISFFNRKHRAPWYFYSTISLSILWGLVIFPFGLVIGLPLILLFLTKRKEFIFNDTADSLAY